jgi:hypothetical protein
MLVRMLRREPLDEPHVLIEPELIIRESSVRRR